MDISQYFDTTLTDCDSRLAVRVIVVPVNSMAPHARSGLMSWATMLGLNRVAVLESEREAVAVLASLLRAGDPAATSVANVALCEARVPFGDPDLKGTALIDIARSDQRGAGSALGTVTLVSLDDWRMLAVAVADGIVLCGEAEAVSGALARGLTAKLRELMGLDGREFSSTGPAAVS